MGKEDNLSFFSHLSSYVRFSLSAVYFDFCPPSLCHMNEAELSDFPARVWRKPSVSTLTCSINGCLPQSAIYLFYSSRYGLYCVQLSYVNVIMRDSLYDIGFELMR